MLPQGGVHGELNNLPVRRGLVLRRHVPAAGVHDVAGAALGFHNAPAVLHVGDVGERTPFCHIHHLTLLYAAVGLSYVSCCVVAVSIAGACGRVPAVEFINGTSQLRRQAREDGAGWPADFLFPHRHRAGTLQTQLCGKLRLGYVLMPPEFPNTEVNMRHLL